MPGLEQAARAWGTLPVAPGPEGLGTLCRRSSAKEPGVPEQSDRSLWIRFGLRPSQAWIWPPAWGDAPHHFQRENPPQPRHPKGLDLPVPPAKGLLRMPPPRRPRSCPRSSARVTRRWMVPVIAPVLPRGGVTMIYGTICGGAAVCARGRQPHRAVGSQVCWGTRGWDWLSGTGIIVLHLPAAGARPRFKAGPRCCGRAGGPAQPPASIPAFVCVGSGFEDSFGEMDVRPHRGRHVPGEIPGRGFLSNNHEAGVREKLPGLRSPSGLGTSDSRSALHVPGPRVPAAGSVLVGSGIRSPACAGRPNREASALPEHPSCLPTHRAAPALDRAEPRVGNPKPQNPNSGQHSTPGSSRRDAQGRGTRWSTPHEPQGVPTKHSPLMATVTGPLAAHGDACNC
ncbi:uncharacterized protein LOC141931597 [Strix aluco]|uniref:uncharacterized protein LOC141931597 n=1 Tax=Strix aluco TaxID=111821 RepID=UPI003DA6BEBC